MHDTTVARRKAKITPKSIRQIEEKGVYTLLVKLDSDEIIRVGKLGQFKFSGLYAYTGSALGRGSSSLNGRVSRHLRSEKKIGWHIDYLLRCPNASVKKVVTSRTVIKSKECEVAKNILNSKGCRATVNKFGSSDCSCQSHLVHLEGNLSEVLRKILRAHREAKLNPGVVIW